MLNRIERLFIKKMIDVENGSNNRPVEKPDFGTDLKKKPIVEHRRIHGTKLIGAVAEGSDNVLYIIRDIPSKYYVEATQLGDYTKSRPNPVNLPNSARFVISNLTQDFALVHHEIEYRKILEELRAAGHEIYIPRVKRGHFDI